MKYLATHFRPSCRLTVSMLFIMFCLLIPHQVWADWSTADVTNRIRITSKLTQNQQYIDVIYPEINFIGRDDGVYNLKISTPDGLIYNSSTPNGSPSTAGGYNYQCRIVKREQVEEDNSSSGKDTQYCTVRIYLKPTTTWQEYNSLSLSVSFDLYIDNTGANPSGTLKQGSKSFSFSDLSLQNLALPTVSISNITYNDNNLLASGNKSSNMGNWSSKVEYANSTSTARGATDDLTATTWQKTFTGKRYDTRYSTYLYPIATRSFSDGVISFNRTLVGNPSLEKLYQKRVTNLQGEITSSGLKLSWSLTDGRDGGKVVIMRQIEGKASTEVARLDDCTSWTDNSFNAHTFAGTYTVLHLTSFESSNPDPSSGDSFSWNIKKQDNLYKDDDGWYEIYNFAQLKTFLNLNEVRDNARLMNDITGTSDVIVSGLNRFYGTFDGQGHTISGLNLTYYLFNINMGTIRNLGIIDSHYENATGAIALDNRGTIENCFALRNTMDAAESASIAYELRGGTIRHCWSAVEGVEELTRMNSGTIESSIHLSNISDPELGSGAVCYAANAGDDIWRQTIGSDPYPVLDTTHARVSKSTPCISYNNTGTTSLEHQIEVVETIPATCIDHGHAVSECTRCHTAETRTTNDLDLPFGDHQYVDGICQVCNAIAPETPLCFTAQENNVEITLNKKGTPAPVSLSYSTDGITWSSYTIGTSISLNQGNKLFMRATDKNATFSKDLSNNYQFKIDGKVAASGSCNTLLDKEGTYSVPTWAFVKLLRCENLTAAPALPATTLAEHCYEDMFNGCTSLTTAPELPATTLAKDCYSGMFVGCSSLTTAPELPATTMVEECYNGMFTGCSSLTTAPELPATTLAESCYYHMFVRCTSLTTAPELPATTLAECCYNSMFAECTSLTNAPELPATTLEELCYAYMFNGCTSLTTGPALPATTLTNGCYTYMFDGCTKLNQIEVSFTEWRRDITATDCWLDNASSTGTFVCPQTLIQNTTTRDVSTVPEGWTFQSNNDAFFASETSTLAKIISNGQHTTQQLTRYDLNHDNKLNIIDLTKLIEVLKSGK